jgi:DNA-directed RNA polymerase subunit N
MLMIIPIRCQSCGKPIAHLHAEYKKRVADGEDPATVLDQMGLRRHCCRAHLLSTVDILPLAARFKKN